MMRYIFTGILLIGIGISCQAQKISLKLVNNSMQEVFNAIEVQAGVFFAYRPDALPVEKNISINVTEADLEDVLVRVLKNTGITFKIKGKYIGISRATLPDIVKLTIKGEVKDASTKEPIPGVNIFIKGTSFGTSAGIDGTFSIEVKDSAVLVFSFIGYKTLEVPVNGRIRLDIELQEESALLNQVTISGGYYSTTDLKKTGSIEKITAKEIERQPITSPLMALQGRMAGVDVTPQNGVAGSATRIVIRGRNSISNGSARPLYIIDGIPINSTRVQNDNVVTNGGFDPLSTINPSNIESIEVLKDADATAIYGSRGANGVILITTKRAKQSEKTNVDVSFYYGAGKIQRHLDVLNTREYVAIRKEAFANSGIPITLESGYDLVVWDTTRQTNWQKELLGKAAVITDLQANISSGNKSTSFRFGIGYHKEGMIAPGDFGYQRVAGNFSLYHVSPNQKFTASVNSNYGVESNKLFAGFSLTDVATTLPPNAPALYDAQGNLNWENSTFSNPIASLRRTDNSEGATLTINSMLGYQLIPALNLRVNLGYNVLNRSGIVKVDPFSAMDPADMNDETRAKANFNTTKRNGWVIEPQAVYAKKIGDLTINGVIGATWQQNRSAFQLLQATGYTSDTQLESLKGASKIEATTDENSDYRYMAFFGRIELDFKERYIINLTGRRDGSSRFGPDKRWGNFGAIGAAWIFSEENFMKKFSFISLAKLRASYGITGSDAVGDYEYLSRYKYMNSLYQGKLSLAPEGLTNDSYAWEQTAKLEAALQIGFLNDRILIETAYYRNRCYNQLLDYQLPATTGFSGVTQNQKAVVQNTGLEITLQSINVSRNDFLWQSSVNFTLPNNKLISYPDIEESPYASTYVVGKPLTIAKLFNYIGVNPTTGLYEVVDVDGNGEFDYRDQTIIQNRDRKYYGGLTNTISYKGFELSFLLQFSQQTFANNSMFALGYSPANLPRSVLGNYWQQEGDLATYQMPSRDAEAWSAAGIATTSNAGYLKCSFVRLKTASLSYTLPEKVLTKIKLQSVRLFMQGQNLLTLSNLKRLDPESSDTALPPLMMFTTGIEVRL